MNNSYRKYYKCSNGEPSHQSCPGKTERECHMKSSIPYMQKLLNKEDVIFKNFSSNISPKSFYASEIHPLDSITIDNLNYNK